MTILRDQASNYTLINFRIPIDLKDQFDQMCRLNCQSRTSILRELMKAYVRDQLQLIKDQLEDQMAFKSFLSDQSSSESRPTNRPPETVGTYTKDPISQIWKPNQKQERKR